MSEEIYFLRVKTLSMKTTRSSSPDEVLKRVMRHILREIQTEFGERANSAINPRRIQFNEVLFGLNTANGVAGVALELMLTAKAARRANAALGIEIVCSLPNDLTIDYQAYFKDAVQWAKKYFDVPMLSAVIHNDEDYPHVHIVMLPMREGKLMGRNLLDDIPKQNAMHKSFNAEVGKRYGLKAPKRYSAEVRHIAMQSAHEYMRDVSGFTDATVDALMKILAKDLSGTMAALGLPMPTEPSQTVAGIFTRDCGRDSAIALRDDERKSAIAFRKDDESGRDCGKNHKRYALIALSNSPLSFPLSIEPQISVSTLPPEPPTTTASTCTTTASAADTEPLQADSPAAADDTDEPADQITRERDSDHRADEWNPDTGEFVAIKPTSGTTHKAIAVASVRMALEGIGTAPPRPSW